MGCICDCLRNCFGQKTDVKTDTKKDKKDDKKPNKDLVAKTNIPFEAMDGGEASESEKAVISEEKLREEAAKAFKGGESSYASLKKLQYHDLEDKELKIVKRWAANHRFEVIANCGSGRYATVYKVYSKRHRKHFAVKVIDISKIGDHYRDNFLPTEIRLMTKLPKHENIVKIVKYFEEQRYKRLFIIMEFATNGTLTEWLRDNGALTEELAHVMFPQILNGIHEFHIRSIAHRDLKLENILLSKTYTPKISDFSYITEVDPNNPLSTQFCGSVPYLAPEILQRQPHNPLISDIWSLGVCFYILLNDKLPFKLGDDSVMLEKQLSKDWSFRTKIERKISGELKDIVTSLLEPNIELRPTTETLKLNPWFASFDKTKALQTINEQNN